MDDNRRQRGLAPYIVVSGQSGTFLVQRGGVLLPGDAPPNVTRPQPVARAQAPTTPILNPNALPHAAWVTPSRQALTDLVR